MQYEMTFKQLLSTSCEYIPLSTMTLCVVQDRDVEEDADFLMVKPGMPYLDIVRDVKNKVRQDDHNIL